METARRQDVARALILLSGTPWEKGPGDLRLYLEWFNRRWNYISEAYPDGQH